MKYKNFWDIYMEYLPDYIFTDNITDLINFIKEKDYYVADIEVKDSYSLNDDATSNLDMIFLEDNLSVKYTDETHPIIIYPYSTFPVVVFPDFFNKYKDLLLKIKTEQDIEKIQGKKNARRKVESTIIINEKFNNLVDIIDYIDDDCNCLIRIENIKLDDVILKKLRSKKINIEYFDENDKKTIISSKYAILYYTYESLKEYKKIIIDETITARDISNLLLVPDDTIIEWKFSGDSIIKSEDYNSIEKALDYLEKNGKKNTVRIHVPKRVPFSQTNLYLKSYQNPRVIVHNDESDYTLCSYVENDLYLSYLVNDIKNSNLTPYEKYMQVYNLVKNFKPYRDNPDDLDAPRSLKYIVDNKYIVCAGFANLLIALLEKVGINAYYYSVEIKKTGQEKDYSRHARVIVNLTDKKYGIDGYYIADPTWDNSLKNNFLTHSTITFEESTQENETFKDNLELELFNINSIYEYIERVKKILSKDEDNSIEFRYKDFVQKILDIFKELNPSYYKLLQNKHQDLMNDMKSFNPKFDENIYKAFIFEIGSHILTKTNKIVDRQKVVQASVMGEHKLRIKKSVLSNLAKRRVESERARLLQIDAIDYKREFPKAFK